MDSVDGNRCGIVGTSHAELFLNEESDFPIFMITAGLNVPEDRHVLCSCLQNWPSNRVSLFRTLIISFHSKYSI